MGFVLGNLGIEEMERRIGITFPDELKKILEDTRQQNAGNVANGKWHCFDEPFMILCGDYDFAEKIHDLLSPYQDFMEEKLQIATEEGTNGR